MIGTIFYNSKVITITSLLPLWICPDPFLWTTDCCKISCHLFYIIHGLGSLLIVTLQYLFISSFMMHSYLPPEFLDLYGALAQENGFMISFFVIISFEMPYSSNKKIKVFCSFFKVLSVTAFR